MLNIHAKEFVPTQSQVKSQTVDFDYLEKKFIENNSCFFTETIKDSLQYYDILFEKVKGHRFKTHYLFPQTLSSIEE